MDSLVLTVTIWMAISQWTVQNDTVNFPNLSTQFPEEYNGMPMKGNVSFFGTTLDGLHSTNFTIDDIKAEESDSDGNNNVCLENFNFGDITLYSKYHADFTISDIPIYGDGEFSFSMKDVRSEVCFTAISNGTYNSIFGVESLNVLMTFRHQPVHIRGFLKNSEADELLLELADLFNAFLAMWHSYDREGATCFFSPLLQYAANAHLKYKGNAFTFDATECLWKGTPLGDLGRIHYSKFSILLQDLLELIQKNKKSVK